MSEGRWLIREIRRDELDEAIALAGERGCVVEPTRVRLRQSLVARNAAGALCGAVFCVGGGQRGVTLEVVLADMAEPQSAADASDESHSGDGAEGHAQAAALPGPGRGVDLARRLIDKLLGKMRCAHLHRCSIRMHGAAATDDLWSAARWEDDRVRPAAAMDAQSASASASASGRTGATEAGSDAGPSVLAEVSTAA